MPKNRGVSHQERKEMFLYLMSTVNAYPSKAMLRKYRDRLNKLVLNYELIQKV